MSKTRIIRIVVFIAGIYFVAVFLTQGIHGGFDKKRVEPTTKIYTDVVKVLGMFAIGVGVFNIFMVHTRRVVRLRKNWEYSIVLLLAFLIVFTSAILRWIGPTSSPDTPVQHIGDIFEFIITRVQVHMNSTIYSFLAFFVTSAALRAFRVRGAESAIMMVAAVVVLLSNAPETSVPVIAEVREWIDLNLNAAVFRALQFGMLLGSITVSLRTWLGIERGALFEEV